MLVRRRRFRLPRPFIGKGPEFRAPPLPAFLVLLLGGPAAGALAVRYLLGSRFLVLDVLFCLQPLRLLYCLLGALLVLLSVRRRPVWLFLLAALTEGLLLGETIRYLPVSGLFSTDGVRFAGGKNASLVVLTQNVNLGDPAAWEEMLKRERPDIACFQEAYVDHLDGWKDLSKTLGYPYTVFQLLRKDAGMGSFVCSRYPMEVLEPVETMSRGGVVRRFPHIVLRTPFGPLHLFSVHLESAPRKFGLKGFLASWPLRYRQAADVAAAVRGVSGAVLVCGDMNATPTERALLPLREVLADAWPRAGRGLGGTWPAGRPLLRIDQVWYRGPLEPTGAHVGSAAWSDHRAVATAFRYLPSGRSAPGPRGEE